MSKKILGVVTTLVIVAAVLVGVNAQAQTVSCANIDAMLSALGVTDAAKVAQAKVAFGCGAATPAASFTRDLTVGSTGADVTALQTKLGVTPATGYFGAITKAAVMAYQTSKGISATGFVGPLTRAALNASVVVVPTTPVTPETPASTLNGGAGSADFSTTTTNVESDVNEGAVNTKVLGFKVEASDSDVSVTNLKVSLQNTGVVSQSTRIDRYLESVSVYMGSKKVGSADIADFTKNGTDYTKSIALSNAVVKEGSANKATFYVVVNALSSIDTANRTVHTNVTVSNIRYVDGSGVNTTDSYSQLQNFGYSTLAASGDVKVVVSKGASSPIAGNVEVSDTSSTDGVLALEFKVKATGSDITFDAVNFIATTTSTSSASNMISRMVLKNGSEEIATLDGSDLAAWNATSTFDLDNTFTVSEGTTETFRIYADVQDSSNFTNGDLTVKLVNSPAIINAEDNNGDDIEETGSAAGETQTFIVNGAVVTYVSESYTAEVTGTDAADGTISIKFTVNALGDNDIVLAEAQGATEDRAAGAKVVSYNVEGATAKDAKISSTSESAVSGDFTVTSGDTKTYTLSVKFASTTGFVRLNITSVDGTSVSNIKTALK